MANSGLGFRSISGSLGLNRIRQQGGGGGHLKRRKRYRFRAATTPSRWANIVSPSVAFSNTSPSSRTVRRPTNIELESPGVGLESPGVGLGSLGVGIGSPGVGLGSPGVGLGSPGAWVSGSGVWVGGDDNGHAATTCFPRSVSNQQ